MEMTPLGEEAFIQAGICTLASDDLIVTNALELPRSQQCSSSPVHISDENSVLQSLHWATPM